MQVPQQRPGGVAVLDRRGGDHHGQHQAQRVHGDVPFPAIDFFRVIPAPAGPGHGVGGADRLGVDHRSGRLGLPPGGGPGLGAQRVVQPGQGAVVAPGSEVPVHSRPGREAVRKVPPGASGPVQVQNRLDDHPQRPDARPAAPPGYLRWQVHGDDLPLGIGQVTGIAPGLPSGHAHTLGMRGLLCLSGLHTSGTQGPRLSISTGLHAATRASPPQPDTRPFIKHSLRAYAELEDHRFTSTMTRAVKTTMKRVPRLHGKQLRGSWLSEQSFRPFNWVARTRSLSSSTP